MKNNVRIILLVCWVIIIFFLAGYPSLKTPAIKDISIDKLYHLIVFFILGILEYRVLKRNLFFIIGCGIAVVAELQQLIIPGRDFEILDIVAGIIGLLLVYFILKWRSAVKNAISKT